VFCDGAAPLGGEAGVPGVAVAFRSLLGVAADSGLTLCSGDSRKSKFAVDAAGEMVTGRLILSNPSISSHQHGNGQTLRKDNENEYTTHCMFGGSVNQEVTSKAVKDRKPALFSAQKHRGDIVGPASRSRGLN
jgi:hypothetical protein